MTSGNQFATFAINNDSEFTGALTNYVIGMNRGEKTIGANFTCAGVYTDKSPILEFFNGKETATLTVTITNVLDSSGETTRTITLNRAMCTTHVQSYDSQQQKLENLNDLLVNIIVTAESATIGGVDWP
jgi:hypothetical protein